MIAVILKGIVVSFSPATADDDDDLDGVCVRFVRGRGQQLLGAGPPQHLLRLRLRRLQGRGEVPGRLRESGLFGGVTVVGTAVVVVLFVVSNDNDDDYNQDDEDDDLAIVLFLLD